MNMLDQNDIALLRGMFAEQDKGFLAAIKENNVDLKREIRDEMHALLAATEHRINARMDEKFENVDGKMSAMETRITTNIAELLDTSVLPQIADLQRDMAIVKRHLQLA